MWSTAVLSETTSAGKCRAKGIHRFAGGLLENDFRHIGMIDKPIRDADDLIGATMRVPDGQMFRDLFTALEARPVTVNINQLYNALATSTRQPGTRRRSTTFSICPRR
jgi:TRAP-type C4-dicarboxylate transport system substrate-binding protein